MFASAAPLAPALAEDELDNEAWLKPDGSEVIVTAAISEVVVATELVVRVVEEEEELVVCDGGGIVNPYKASNAATTYRGCRCASRGAGGGTERR